MKLLILLGLFVSSAVSYKILCLHPIPSKSHFHLVNGIVQPLLKAGHEVTFATVYPESVKANKNLRTIDLSNHYKLLTLDMSNPDTTIADVKSFARNLSLAMVQNPNIREMMVKEQFDAIMTEWFFTDIEAGYAAIQGVPWLVLSGNVIHTKVEGLVDAVRTVPLIPNLHLPFSVPMNFWQRLLNSFIHVMMTIDDWLEYQTFKTDYEVNFGPLAAARGISLPPYDDVVKNVSIMFSNSHSSYAYARSTPPNLVEIGGYHIDANIPALPKDLQEILDKSTDGIVYFSMGSVLKATALNEKTRRQLIEVFGKLKQTVLWKFDEKIDNLPKNVHIRSWMPQSSILAHRNIKVFITHGGLLSTLESINYGVPVIMIPVFADQPYNAAQAVKAGYGLQVKYSENMAPDVEKVVAEMLSNSSYYEKAKYMQKLLTSRPTKPSELITHYVELAIETKGATHLRSVIHMYQWYEYLMLDQLAFVLVILFVIYYVIKKLIGCIRPQKTKAKRKRD